VASALITFFGLVMDMGHYGVFKLPKYTTRPKECSARDPIIFIAVGVIVKWWFF
jgi:hypothetical protein